MTRPARDVLDFLVGLVFAAILVFTGLLHQVLGATVDLLAHLGESGGASPSRMVYPPARQVLAGVARVHDGLAQVASTVHSSFSTLEGLVWRLDSGLRSLQRRVLSK